MEIHNNSFNSILDFDYRHVGRKIVELHAIFQSCYSLCNAPDSSDSRLYKQYEEHFFERASALLIEVAALVREISNRSDAEEEEELVSRSICGELVKEDGTKTETLSTREACNKILHHKKVNFDDARPQIYVYGTKYDKNWKATIDILEFCENCAGVAGPRSLTEWLGKEKFPSQSAHLPFKRRQE